MREVEFRGKDSTGVMNHDWFYGSLDTSFNEDFPRIICKDKWGNTMLITVDGETVCQYTGLKDKKGTKIFEGDIVKGTIVSQWAKEEIVCYVEYQNDSFVCIEDDKWKHKLMFAKNIEVIGNIYDNPELLEVADGR